MIQHAFGDNARRPASTALTAVKAYFADTHIRTASTTLASQLDKLMGTR